MQDVDGLNAGYAKALLEEYLENPAGVPDEWRRLFESGSSELVATHPGLAQLLETLREEGNGHRGAAVVEPAPAPALPPEPAQPMPAQPTTAQLDEEFLRAVAAATELVGAYRSHGHLAARLDPLGTEPVGDPSLIWFGSSASARSSAVWTAMIGRSEDRKKLARSRLRRRAARPPARKGNGRPGPG
jgi:2-oxoglutarate dehydrogenase complex dehydrogenase (E1) component-like enzyme